MYKCKKLFFHVALYYYTSNMLVRNGFQSENFRWLSVVVSDSQYWYRSVHMKLQLKMRFRYGFAHIWNVYRHMNSILPNQTDIRNGQQWSIAHSPCFIISIIVIDELVDRQYFPNGIYLQSRCTPHYMYWTICIVTNKWAAKNFIGTMCHI